MFQSYFISSDVSHIGSVYKKNRAFFLSAKFDLMRRGMSQGDKMTTRTYYAISNTSTSIKVGAYQLHRERHEDDVDER